MFGIKKDLVTSRTVFAFFARAIVTRAELCRVKLVRRKINQGLVILPTSLYGLDFWCSFDVSSVLKQGVVSATHVLRSSNP